MDTATAEIYTYVHTLSLHDALPICYLAVWAGFSLAATLLQWALDQLALLSSMGGAGTRLGGALFVAAGIYQLTPLKQACLTHCRSRSEEHTSELQSLMRISYAVFCLKKTKEN